MPQPRKAGRFGGAPAHHNMIMANLATELIRHGRITTTLAKAKTVQPIAERMITFAKRGDLHARRQVLRVIRDRDVVHKLFSDVGPAFAEREGGYTRVLKTGPRKGDAAPMALIELVQGVSAVGEGTLEEEPRRRWSLRRRRGTVSATAQQREEDRAALVDRGEEPAFAAAAGEQEDDEQPDAETRSETQTGATPEEPDEDAPQADPAEVEARLAAEETVDRVEDAVTDPDLDDRETVEEVEEILDDAEADDDARGDRPT